MPNQTSHNAHTQAGRQTRSAQYRAARETEAQIDAVFASDIGAVLAHYARIVATDRARLDRERALTAQINAVFA